MAEHFFGRSTEGLSQGERLCNEPIVPKVIYTRIYHVHFTVLPNGNAQCNHCSETFIHAEDPREPNRE